MMMRTKRTRTKKTTAPTIRRACASRTRTNQDACSPVTRCGSRDDKRNCGHGGQQLRLPEGHRDDQSGTQEETSGACAPHIAQGAQRCRDRGDRGGLVRVHGPHRDGAGRAQQVSATPKRVVSIVISRSAPRPPLALEVPPTRLARAGEVIEMVIEIEFSCAVRECGARAPWTGRVMSLTQRCREASSNETPGRL